MKKIAFLVAVCAIWPMSSNAQKCAHLQFMDVDSDRVYNAHEEIKYDEPHGIYSGQMSVDTLYFVCPIRSALSTNANQNQNETFQEGTIVVLVRRATDRQWTRKTFNYDCEDRTLKAGKMEWAFSNDRRLQVGFRNSSCTLQ
jgi:hypothetical protein